MTKRRPDGHGAHDSGAVLVTILLIVAVMSAVAVALVDDIRFGIKRAGNVAAGSQATWYALSSETLAIEALNQTFSANPDRTSLDQPWATAETRFPVEGGFIDSDIRDASNCFNVNSLVTAGESTTLTANEATRRQFERLLQNIGLTEGDAEAVAGAVTDWIDSDTRPVARGAEDFDYALQSPPYRTPNSLIADISELRAIKGFEEDGLFDRISPLLCALPMSDPAVLNLNTIPVEAAPLLAMLSADGINLTSITAAISERSSAGYSSAEEFWQTPSLESVELTETIRNQTGLKASYFTLTTLVSYRELDQIAVSLIAIDPAGAYVVSRQFGELE